MNTVLIKDRCHICHIIKPLSDFYRNSKRHSDHQSFCIDCSKQRDKQRTSYHLNYQRQRRAQFRGISAILCNINLFTAYIDDILISLLIAELMQS